VEVTPNPRFWHNIDQLINDSKIVIDRPKGSQHPRFPTIIYPTAYGYLEGTSAMDGGGIDVWVGNIVLSSIRGASGGHKLKSTGIIVTLDLLKRDAEVKILIGCSEDETERIMRLTNEHDVFQGVLVRRGDS